MAVSIDVQALAVDLRVIADPTDTIPVGVDAVLTRHLATATALVLADAPNAPDAIHDAAVARCAAYLYDADPAATRGVQSPLRESGAVALLSRWKSRRLTGV